MSAHLALHGQRAGQQPGWLALQAWHAALAGRPSEHSPHATWLEAMTATSSPDSGAFLQHFFDLI